VKTYPVADGGCGRHLCSDATSARRLNARPRGWGAVQAERGKELLGRRRELSDVRLRPLRL
jgi:hypothetical protein